MRSDGEFAFWNMLIEFLHLVAVSPGDQLLHPERKKTKAVRHSDEDQVDSVHDNRE